MKNESIFTFVKQLSEELVSVADRVEELMFDQPNAALTQARLYSEILVKMISKQEKIEEIYPVPHSDRIHKLFRQNAIEEGLYKKLEMIRKKGNKAVHNVEEADFNDVLPIHEALFDASVWYMQVYVRYDFEAPQYEPPVKAKSENNHRKSCKTICRRKT
ncbi:MAG: DUF4145 domain-containing protein [Bacillaceae bacterium]|nr:DUF4145 domain-containing protein [Bacillaceae bacterium]